MAISTATAILLWLRTAGHWPGAPVKRPNSPRRAPVSVDLPGRELRIRAEKAKDGEDRLLPISSRLAAVLEMAKTDPAGKAYGPDAYVFGELGLPTTRKRVRSWDRNLASRAPLPVPRLAVAPHRQFASGSGGRGSGRWFALPPRPR
jgi:hypothetical protein